MEKRVDDGYKELAVAIVGQAFDDYKEHLLRPNWDAECELAAEINRECRNATQFVLTAYEYYIEDKSTDDVPMKFLKRCITDFIDWARKQRMTMACYQPKENSRWLGDLRNRAAKAKDLPELTEIAKSLRKRTSSFKSGVNHLNASWQREFKELLKFFESDSYYLYTNGRIEPEAVLTELKRKVANGE